MFKKWLWIDIGLVIFTAILIAGLMLFGLVFFSGLFGQMQLQDKYELLRDLLVILLAAVTASGLLLYKLLEQALGKRVEEKFSRLEGRALVMEGFQYWHMKDLRKAIERTKGALQYNLDELTRVQAINNLAYYLAEEDRNRISSDWQHEREAQRLAQTAKRRYDKYIEGYDNPEWLETHIYVLCTYSKTEKERENIKALIESYLRRPELNPIHEKLIVDDLSWLITRVY